MKKCISVLMSGLLVLNLAACTSAKPAEVKPTESTVSVSEAPGIYEPGVYTAVTKGFGGDITVKVTVDSHQIIDVLAEGNEETDGIGSKALEELPGQLLAAQGTEVDGVSGATVTTDAIKTAFLAALNQAMGIEEVAAQMQDGTYQTTAPSYAEVNGLATTGALTMSVTVADNKIAAVEVTEYTDTDIIGGMAFTMLGDQVIEHQSMKLDAVSGATVSSNAFFAALSDCVEQAGGSAAALKGVDVVKEAAKVEEIETDILVIGAGMAGLTASIEAAELGADVILLEKNSVYSSSTTRSLGYIVGAGTETQKEFGIEDDAEAFYQDITSLYAGEPEIDTSLLRVMADKSASLNSWLTEHGLEFSGVIHKSEKGERKTERIHTTEGGSALTSTLVRAAEEAGVQIMLGTPATSLIQNADGSISGAMATNTNGDQITIRAKATIVCAGSYTNNPELFNTLNPRINNIAYACGSGEGDAYKWFLDVNADIIEIPYTQFMYYSYAPSFAEMPEVIPNSPDTPVYDILLVTGGGERVTAEDNFCFEFTKENWERGYDEGYAVVGQDFADKYPILMNNVLNNVVPGSGLPFAYQADTISQLAEYVEIEPEVLEATVARYNELCEAGVDTDFGKDSKYMEALDGTFYIIRLPMITTDGYTGARVNECGQVLDQDGNWIPGLYAAGSSAVAQTVSVNYFGCGTSLMTCGVFGREAAIDAVKRINE